VKQRRRRKIRKRNLNRDINETTFSYNRKDNNSTPFDDIPLPRTDTNETEAPNMKPKRLTTHIFHTKRMHMNDLWGFRLAETSCSKIYRVAYRFQRQHSTIHDSSYLICVQLQSINLDSLIKSLTELTLRKTESLFSLQSMYGPEGKREGQFIMYDNSEVLNCLGPVRFLFQQRDDHDSYSCMLWMHPSTLPESWQYIQQVAEQNNGKIYL
jgi:ribonuclease P/MRP protein subunit POP1